jgi:plastocyanin
MRSLNRSGIVPALALTTLLAFGSLGCGDDDEKPPTGPGGGGGGGADVTITIVANAGSNSYSPDPDTVTVGQTVSWKNNDVGTHTATSDVVAWGTGAISPGATSTPIAMNTAGSFPYHCEIHPTMVATLVVVP